MEYIKDLLKEYLSEETDYALFLAGKWGSGKTYFFKKELMPIISAQPVLKTGGEKIYKVIYLSLFGMKGLEDLQTQILLSIYGVNGKKTKMAASIAIACIKGLYQIPNIDVSSGDVSSKTLDIRGFQDCVLCLDDLERKHSDFDSGELMSYINYLIENHGAKILIIGNEDKMGDDFTKIKEKIIGNVIEFNPNYEDVIQSIIGNLALESNSLKEEFLSENSNFIFETFLKTSGNLRSLKFALIRFLHVYELIDSELSDDVYNRFRNDVYVSLLYFTIIISSEYRDGAISYTERRGIEDGQNQMIKRYLRNMNKDSEKSSENIEKEYDEFFYERYQREGYYRFYPTIYNYITGGSSLDCNCLLNEIRTEYQIEIEEKLPKYLVLEKLNWTNYYKLSDEEYKQETLDLVDYGVRGLYNTCADYLSVFIFGTRGNVIEYTPEILVKKIMKAVNNSKIIYSDTFGYSKKKYLDEFGLYNFLEEVNRRALIDDEGTEMIERNNLLKKDPILFLNKLDSVGYFVLKGIKPELLYEVFVASSNNIKFEFISSFGNLNRSSYFTLNSLYSDLQRLLIKGKDAVEVNSLGGYLYKEFRLIVSQLVSITQGDAKS